MYDTKKFFNDRAAVWDRLAEGQDPEKLCVMLILPAESGEVIYVRRIDIMHN
jgi:hypothetical protein